MAKSKTQSSVLILRLASRIGMFTILAVLLLSPRASFAQQRHHVEASERSD